jgi:hypothetical protein
MQNEGWGPSTERFPRQGWTTEIILKPSIDRVYPVLGFEVIAAVNSPSPQDRGHSFLTIRRASAVSHKSSHRLAFRCAGWRACRISPTNSHKSERAWDSVNRPCTVKSVSGTSVSRISEMLSSLGVCERICSHKSQSELCEPSCTKRNFYSDSLTGKMSRARGFILTSINLEGCMRSTH